MWIPGSVQVSQMLHVGIIYRHLVLTIPALLRTTFYHAFALLSPFMRCGVQWGWMIVSAGQW